MMAEPTAVANSCRRYQPHATRGEVYSDMRMSPRGRNIFLAVAVLGAVAMAVGVLRDFSWRSLSRRPTSLPERQRAVPEKQWPPPGFPLVEGQHALTAEWSINLPEQFARRVEDGSLVLWRPGLTLWLTAWGNDHNESQSERLDGIKRTASPTRTDERVSQKRRLTRWSYRLRDRSSDGTAVESVYGFVIDERGHLQLAIYFDDVADEAKARALVESVSAR
jgi:hypothetical protein